MRYRNGQRHLLFFEQQSQETSAPLFFTFHGTGGDEHQFPDLALQLLPTSHVISPRGDVSENGALRFFGRTVEGVYDMKDLSMRTAKMANFICKYRNTSTAPRVIGLGYSNGANILASVLFTHPELFDDVILMHPLVPWAPAANNALSGKRILITAGRNDPICPAIMSERLEHYFLQQRANISMQWHAGGHELRQNEIEAAKTFIHTK
jgi:phospholipase/carboxylesterase